MLLDRERFLAMALALAGCAKQGGGIATMEGGGGSDWVDPWADPACTGVAYTDERDLCVAWRDGRVKKGFVPTAECANWDDAGRCTGTLFTQK
jgi:hypothetical protein